MEYKALKKETRLHAKTPAQLKKSSGFYLEDKRNERIQHTSKVIQRVKWKYIGGDWECMETLTKRQVRDGHDKKPTLTPGADKIGLIYDTATSEWERTAPPPPAAAAAGGGETSSSRWDKRDPDKPLSRDEHIAYAQHIGLLHSHPPHGSNYVASMADLDKSLAEQLRISAGHEADRKKREESEAQKREKRRGGGGSGPEGGAASGGGGV